REVFDKPDDFDPTQDSIVRVYAHNLRRKLERYYQKEGRARPYRLGVARGEYRLILTSSRTDDGGTRSPPTRPMPKPIAWRMGLAVAVVAGSLAIAITSGFALRHAFEARPSSPPAELATSAIW